jgi:uncharacterized NAD(P)/FAD-binding protein YdhS
MKSIAIIGCGFSGTMVAVNLIRKAAEPFDLILIDRKSSFNKGIAYNPTSVQHLLNVRASKMSAFPGIPGNFLTWYSGYLKEQTKSDHQNLDDFAPRYLYGKYLESIWKEACEMASAKNIRLHYIDGYVTSLDQRDGNWFINTDKEEMVKAGFCVIATGYGLPMPPIPHPSFKEFYESSSYQGDPWKRVNIPSGSLHPVLILGNGLSMADMVISLRESGYTGKIYTLSRHGFMLRQHPDEAKDQNFTFAVEKSMCNMADLVSIIHQRVKNSHEPEQTFMRIIDSLRPETNDIWRQLTRYDQSIFLERYRYLWDSFRHRAPEHVLRQLDREATIGTWVSLAGHVVDFKQATEGVDVLMTTAKTGKAEDLRVSLVINCTGPVTGDLQSGQGFMSDCIKKGLVAREYHKIGFNADPKTYHAIDYSGNRISSLFLIGPLLRGVLWETTAVREIREQALDIASRLARVK